MNFLKNFGAGFTAVGQGFVKNWKEILLCTLAVAIGAPIVAALLLFVVNLLHAVITWVASIQWFADFVLAHSVAIVYGVLGSMLVGSILLCIYSTGKEKRQKEQNDKVSSI